MSTLHAADDHSLTDEDIDLFTPLCQRTGWSDQYLTENEPISTATAVSPPRVSRAGRRW